MNADTENVDRSPRKPEPVSGVEIRLSTKATVAKLAGAALLFLWGCGLLFLFIRNTFFEIDPPKATQSPQRILLFSAVLIFGSIVSGVALFQGLRRGRRVVVGWDRVQVVEGLNDLAAVRLQIPYLNIERMKVTRLDFGVRRLEFVLSDSGDPETFLPKEDTNDNFRKHGYHYALRETYLESKDNILDRIESAIEGWRNSAD